MKPFRDGTSITILLSSYSPGAQQTFTYVQPTPSSPSPPQLVAELNLPGGFFPGGIVDVSNNQVSTLTIDSGGKTGSFDFHFTMSRFGAKDQHVRAMGPFTCP